MSASVLLDAQPTPQTAPFALSVHLAVTLNVTAEDARRAVNRQVVTELGTGLVARDPELVIAGERILWRVPIALSLPNLGDLGQVGTGGRGRSHWRYCAHPRSARENHSTCPQALYRRDITSKVIQARVCRPAFEWCRPL